MRKYLLTMLLILFAVPVFAQTYQTRYGAEAAIGSAGSLGYATPYYRFGAALERDLPKRFEIQAHTWVSPTNKLVTRDGTTFQLGGGVLYWLSNRAALDIGDRHTLLFTDQFFKSGNNPHLGFVTRFIVLDVPSRFYVRYIFPIGARPTNGALQSNRTQGAEITFEGQPHNRIRFGFTVQVLTFLSQSGAGQSPRSWAGTSVLYARFGKSQDSDRIY